MQSEEGQNGQNDDDQANEIDQSAHEGSLRECNLWSTCPPPASFLCRSAQVAPAALGQVKGRPAGCGGPVPYVENGRESEARLENIRQAEFFPDHSAPEGFRYAPDTLSETMERTLVQTFAQLPFRPFAFHGYFGKRRIVTYGYDYDYAERALRESGELPGFLLPLRGVAAAFAGVPADTLEQAMVTEYAPGAGIGWHRDKPMFSDVIAFSFLAPCVLRFRRKRNAAWDRYKQRLSPCSVYLLRGASRWEWYHSIPGVEALRYSVTFRNFMPERR